MSDIIISDYIVSLAPYKENRRRFALPYCIPCSMFLLLTQSWLLPCFMTAIAGRTGGGKKEKRDLTTSSRFRHNHRFLDLGRLVLDNEYRWTEKWTVGKFKKINKQTADEYQKIESSDDSHPYLYILVETDLFRASSPASNYTNQKRVAGWMPLPDFAFPTATLTWLVLGDCWRRGAWWAPLRSYIQRSRWFTFPWLSLLTFPSFRS